MALERNAIKASLLAKGFTEDIDRDHDYFLLFDPITGKKTPIFTKVSRGSKYKTIPDGLVQAMARQCRLTKQNFSGLVECSLSKEAYMTILREQDLIQKPPTDDNDA